MKPDKPTIHPFNPADQECVRKLILEGLAGHVGELDPSLNPDLDDIASHYANTVILISKQGDVITGCGMLIPLDAETGEIVRMSVSKGSRRQGIGLQILDALREAARKRGLKRLVLETTSSWESARRFYESRGFRFTHYQDHPFGQQAYYELEL